MDLLLNERIEPAALMQAFRNLQSSWVKPATASADELYGTLAKELEASQVLELDQAEANGRIEELFVKLPWLAQLGISRERCLDEVAAIVNRMRDSVPAQLQTPSKFVEDYQTVEMEQEIETETERETETELSSQQAGAKKERMAVLRAEKQLVGDRLFCRSFRSS